MDIGLALIYKNNCVVCYVQHQECIRTGVTGVRACNYVKIETGRNFSASTKNSNTHCAGCVKC